jgi:predicted enzyme related to lactoylglutathione lyase
MDKTLVNEQVGFIASFEDTEGNEIYLHSQK